MKQAYRVFLITFYLSLTICTSCQNTSPHIDPLQYPKGYPHPAYTALQQLKNYPLPRYMPGNNLMRLFNWMDPTYFGMLTEPGDKSASAIANRCNVQKELSADWNYGIVIPNSGAEFNGPKDTTCPPYIRLANQYPNIPLDIITFWTQEDPSILGYKQSNPMIRESSIDAPYLLSNNTLGEVKFNFPDSLIAIDGKVQKFYLERLLKCLTRPINRINENGEEAPGAELLGYLPGDPDMVKMKDSMKISSWKDFMSIRKLEMRNTYSSAFMKELPELHNTFFSFYADEGGPIDRFDWHIMKKCMTPVNGIYYSTPDFYPRWSKNWKDWTGAWHGWKWIEIGRQTEIKDGDYLFSPFVAAGWSRNPADDIRPGQWLGLLKCLSVIGAEFYYVGYFNLSPPFNDPAEYAWQAAMPAYAQATTSRFEDVLKNGNVLFDSKGQPIITYNTGDRHVLITARKHNTKNKYVISATYQPFSNDSGEIPEKTNVSATIDGHSLSFEARRQGSVYIYEKTLDNRTVFYQLDKWHENAHPDYWSKDFYFEAEIADSGVTDERDIYTLSAENDYTHFISYVHLIPGRECLYHFGDRDTINHTHFLWIYYKGSGSLSFELNNNNGSKDVQKTNLPACENWKWARIEIPSTYNYCGNNTLKISTLKGEIDLDKFVITTKGNTAPIY